MLLYLAARTVVTASYLELLNSNYTNNRESKMQLHASYSRRADYVTSHVCSSHYTSCL